MKDKFSNDIYLFLHPYKKKFLHIDESYVQLFRAYAQILLNITFVWMQRQFRFDFIQIDYP